MPKQIPLLYSTPMVKAVLANIKTVTRRTRGLKKINADPDNWEYVRFWDGHAKFCEKHNYINEQYVKCPYGEVGDVIWVRETFCEPTLYDGCEQDYYYKADRPNDKKCTERNAYGEKWKPSIHMPKAASRIWLEITDIRVERVQDITEEQAKSEGAFKVWESIENNFYHPEADTVKLVGDVGDYKTGFKAIWVSINGRESWEANVFVWVISFKVLSTTGKPEGVE